MNAQPGLVIFEDVEGAPVRLGEWVRIAGEPALEDSVDRRFLGHRGRVVALVYDAPREQFPADPLVQVHVEDLGEELFFVRELERMGVWTWHVRAERHCPR
jgi:hypothetical protein